ncbi:hypothetical protein TYRP_000185 [Tyrophagus putrescentiae]|nr:hypothetical protein TYRP_000185 [Tyrophagus putrescentiae]
MVPRLPKQSRRSTAQRGSAWTREATGSWAKANRATRATGAPSKRSPLVKVGAVRYEAEVDGRVGT